MPRDNLLVEGDLIDMAWIQHPWAENYRKNLAMRKIRFAKHIPVHGRIATFEEETRRDQEREPSDLARGAWPYQLPCFMRLCFARKSRISA